MTSLDSKSQRLKRSWGQHLLINRDILEFIANNVSRESDNGVVIEFAAGSGNLTEYLLESCEKVIAIEMERDVLKSLKKRFAGNNHLELLEMNMMNFDFRKFFEIYGRVVIVGNLPYNLSKLFLFKVFENAVYIKSAFLMFQYEVAKRVVANTGDRDWSTMSVFARMLSNPEIIKVVGRGSFFPPPRVDSAIIYFNFYEDISRYKLYKECNRSIQEIFNYPRKSMRSILKARFGEDILLSIQDILDITKRPQNLTILEIEKICEIIRSKI
ncbi:MAG: 16S rRNA (adenine(1518)-N(6)/adenine(1519)-N(6))-dimethyltransferase RsmA [Myxococcota bacterium]